MFDYLERTAAVFTEDEILKLQNSRVAVLGLGGVGSAAAEALCRGGVGNILLCDSDSYSLSNLNRQLFATRETVGRKKAEAARERLLSINPNVNIEIFDDFILPETAEGVFKFCPDAIVDAIDTVTAKLYFAEEAKKRNIIMVSSLGTGNRRNPAMLKIGDISDTKGTGCPLARVMRRELSRRGLDSLKVVFSLEQPQKGICTDAENGRHSPGSSSFVPPAAGFMLAYAAVEELLNRK